MKNLSVLRLIWENFKIGTYVTYTAKLALKLVLYVNCYFPQSSEGNFNSFHPLYVLSASNPAHQTCKQVEVILCAR